MKTWRRIQASQRLLTFRLSVFILFSLPCILTSQSPSIQDCINAIPICSALYEEAVVPNGPGGISREVSSDISCLLEDNNSIWYTFTVNSSGNFGFVLTPNNLNDDFDWGLWNLTNASCSDISSDASLLVSCNAAGGESCNGLTGATGGSEYNIQGGGCSDPTPTQIKAQSPFNDLIPVEAGNTYVLMVSNWSQSGNGYQIDFSLSEDIGILDQKGPEIRNYTTDVDDGCEPTQIEIEFSESIQCGTIGDINAILTHENGTQYDVSLSSPECEIGGGQSRTFFVTIQDEITASGIYTLDIVGRTEKKILDLCGNAASNNFFTFQIENTILENQDLPADTVLCRNASISLDIFDPAATSYLWSTGEMTSSITISRPGNYQVDVSNRCEEKKYNLEVIGSSCEDCNLYIPNVFSPFSNNGNSTFSISSTCPFVEYDLQVFDRWGNQVYYSNNPTDAWNGLYENKKMASNQVLVYRLEYAVTEFTEVKEEVLTGELMIVY